MNNVLVLCKGTGQARAFERVVNEFTAKNNLPIEWIYANDKEYLEIIKEKNVKVVMISPEVVLLEKEISAELDNLNIPHITLKPIVFGLKDTSKFMPQIEPFLDL